MREAQAAYEKRAHGGEPARLKEQIRSLDAQLEALAERISRLPTGVPVEPFYKQMGEIQELKEATEARLRAMENDPARQELPATLPAYEAFLTALGSFANDPIILENRIKIIQRLIHRIEIRPGTFRLHFHVGKNYVDGELAIVGSPAGFRPPITQKAPEILSPGLRYSNLGSNSLTNGWGTRI